MNNEIVPTDISNSEKINALVSHLLGIFTTFVGALIIWYWSKGKSPFVEEQSREALNFQITILIGFSIAGALSFLPTGFILVPLITVYNIAMCIIAAMSARDGKSYVYPISIRFIQ